MHCLRVFIAYGGREAEDIASLLHDYLDGFRVIEPYQAPHDNGIGKWPAPVKEALKKSDVFLVVWATGSSSSTELFKEIILADEWEIKFETLLDDRIRTTDPTLPPVIQASDISPLNVANPLSSFEGILPKLKQCAVSLPYGGLKLAEAVSV
jgi:hypothetical protein